MEQLHVVVAGASGFLGQALVAELGSRGHRVTRLVRRDPTGGGESQWDPYAGTDGRLDAAVIEDADVVVNLAGAPTVGNPHSKKWARELLESRVRTTHALAVAIAGSQRRPAFLAGNGISYYGDHGDAVVTEASESRGDALLTRVTRDWEAAADPARAAGARVCVLRTSPVMDRRHAPLQQLRLLFKAGLGGRIGSGRQYMPMSTLRDWVGATIFLAEHDTVSGPVNIALPEAPTNAEFTRALAAALHRKAFLPAPAAVVRPAAGAMGPELLGSVRAHPSVLLEAGFTFADPDVASLLRTGLAG